MIVNRLINSTYVDYDRFRTYIHMNGADPEREGEIQFLPEEFDARIYLNFILYSVTDFANPDNYLIINLTSFAEEVDIHIEQIENAFLNYLYDDIYLMSHEDFHDLSINQKIKLFIDHTDSRKDESSILPSNEFREYLANRDLIKLIENIFDIKRIKESLDSAV